MKRLALAIAAAAVLAAVPAQAKKPPHPSHPAHPNSHSNKGRHLGKCHVRKVGYNASGTLVSATLTKVGKNRYDGSITVDVTRANHKAPKGTQTFTLTNARVLFGKGVDQTNPASGSRVRLHGKITALPRHCSSSGFTPSITIRQVRISKPHKHT